jgi:LacI family transcriptional regulator
MKVDNQQIGVAAANELLAVIAGKQERAQSREVVPVLKIRESSGKLKPKPRAKGR